MINVVVSVGSGDRFMPDINDNLIIDNTMAMIRAQQALAATTYITKTETLNMPHDPNGVVGTIADEFSFTPLDIFGRYFITSLTISLTPESATDTVTAERYGRLIL